MRTDRERTLPFGPLQGSQTRRAGEFDRFATVETSQMFAYKPGRHEWAGSLATARDDNRAGFGKHGSLYFSESIKVPLKKNQKR